MRAAEEIVLSLMKEGDLFYINKQTKDDICECNATTIIAAINEARKEAIEECANHAEKYLVQDVCESDFEIKESILSLINKLQ